MEGSVDVGQGLGYGSRRDDRNRDSTPHDRERGSLVLDHTEHIGRISEYVAEWDFDMLRHQSIVHRTASGTLGSSELGGRCEVFHLQLHTWQRRVPDNLFDGRFH